MNIMVRSVHSRVTGWRFLWMKRVKGFRSDFHCARCLEGSFVKGLGTSLATNVPHAVAADDGDLFYLCGVSAPYVWANNLHMALCAKAGSVVTVAAYNGEVFTVEHAELVPFDDVAARRRFAGRGSEFLTCRNFQFGAHFFTD